MTAANLNLNPQGEQMADESMIRTLAAQIEAIWPQEKALLNFYRLPRNARVLDVGSGTGEFSARVADACQSAGTGVELLAASVELARSKHAALAPRLAFEVGDAFALAQPDNSFDLVANRTWSSPCRTSTDPGRARARHEARRPRARAGRGLHDAAHDVRAARSGRASGARVRWSSPSAPAPTRASARVPGA
jgi:SAM-dependent methyltransferase